MVSSVNTLQLLASVRLSEYSPAARSVRSSSVEVNQPGPVQLIAYGCVPPLMVMLIDPSSDP